MQPDQARDPPGFLLLVLCGLIVLYPLLPDSVSNFASRIVSKTSRLTNLTLGLLRNSPIYPLSLGLSGSMSSVGGPARNSRSN